MTTRLGLQDNQIKISAQKALVFPLAAKGLNFYDYELELKDCWINSGGRDWSRFMRDETFSYSWDFREVEHRK